jgi:hypothetical protein
LSKRFGGTRIVAGTVGRGAGSEESVRGGGEEVDPGSKQSQAEKQREEKS